MKKNYQKPTTHVILLDTAAMVCGSITGLTGVSDLSIDNNGTDDAGITTGNARRNTLWDDDEEDEY